MGSEVREVSEFPKVVARLASLGALAGLRQGSLPYPVTRHVTTHVPMSPPSPVIRPLSIPETWVRNSYTSI